MDSYCKQCGRLLHSKCRKGLCDKHYMQQLKYGEFLDDSPYCKNDPNKIITYDDYSKVILRDIHGYAIAEVIIDTDKINLVEKYKWSYHHSGYAITKIDRKNIQMHRLIMNVNDPSLLIDHINHNTLDNRLSNLRIVDYNKNSWNSKTSSRNTSGVKGVNFDSKQQKWRVRISYNGKRYELGYYDTLDEAIEVRKKAEDNYYAEYNFKNDDDR